MTVLLISSVGVLYAIIDGLKAVAVYDTINDLELIAPDNSDKIAGVSRLLTDHPEKLNAISDQDAPTSFGTLFARLLNIDLFYWCTIQYVIQRTSAVRSLAEGQKSVLL